MIANNITGIKTSGEFYLDLYNRTYLLTIGMTREEANKWLSEKLGVPHDVGDVSDLHGQVDKVKGKDFTAIVIFLHNMEIGTLVHEAVHAANWTFSHAGIEADVDNDEPQAYLVGWIVKKIYEVANEYNAERQRQHHVSIT